MGYSRDHILANKHGRKSYFGSNEKRKKQRKKMQATIIKYVKNQRKCIIAMLSAINAAVEREFWVEPTRGHGYFWEHTISSWTEDRLWIANFRMKKSTFYFICEQLSPVLKRRHTRFRMSIPVEKMSTVARPVFGQ